MEDKDEKSIERYSFAASYASTAAELFWIIFGNFLLVHAIFFAFLLHSSFTDTTICTYRPGVFVGGIAGVLLCIPWTTSAWRSGIYHNLRVYQAREAEPLGWDLIAGKGKDIAEGKKVTIDGKIMKINKFCMILKTKHCAGFVIAIFCVLYLWIISANGPWNS